MQADGADELLLKTVPPRLSHVRGHHGADRHTLYVPTRIRPLGLSVLAEKPLKKQT